MTLSKDISIIPTYNNLMWQLKSVFSTEVMWRVVRGDFKWELNVDHHRHFVPSNLVNWSQNECVTYEILRIFRYYRLLNMIDGLIYINWERSERELMNVSSHEDFKNFSISFRLQCHESLMLNWIQFSIASISCLTEQIIFASGESSIA